MDGGLIFVIIMIRIHQGHRRFAQHVIAVGETGRFLTASPLERFIDRFSGDELFAHQLHRHVDTAADHWLTGSFEQSRQRRTKSPLVDRRDQLA